MIYRWKNIRTFIFFIFLCGSSQLGAFPFHIRVLGNPLTGKIVIFVGDNHIFGSWRNNIEQLKIISQCVLELQQTRQQLEILFEGPLWYDVPVTEQGLESLYARLTKSWGLPKSQMKEGGLNECVSKFIRRLFSQSTYLVWELGYVLASLVSSNGNNIKAQSIDPRSWCIDSVGLLSHMNYKGSGSLYEVFDRCWKALALCELKDGQKISPKLEKIIADLRLGIDNDLADIGDIIALDDDRLKTVYSVDSFSKHFTENEQESIKSLLEDNYYLGDLIELRILTELLKPDGPLKTVVFCGNEHLENVSSYLKDGGFEEITRVDWLKKAQEQWFEANASILRHQGFLPLSYGLERKINDNLRQLLLMPPNEIWQLRKQQSEEERSRNKKRTLYTIGNEERFKRPKIR